jgi:hypothetical protein
MMSHTPQIEERDEMLEMAEQLHDMNHAEESLDMLTINTFNGDLPAKPEEIFSRSFFASMPAFGSSQRQRLPALYKPMMNTSTNRCVTDCFGELDDIVDMVQTDPKPVYNFPESQLSNVLMFGSCQHKPQPQQLTLASQLEELDSILEMAEQVLDLDPLDMTKNPLNVHYAKKAGRCDIS